VAAVAGDLTVVGFDDVPEIGLSSRRWRRPTGLPRRGWAAT